MPKFIELMADSKGKMNKVALGIDLRGREFFEHLWEALDDLSERTWIIPHILFLDAKDSTLVTRYKETETLASTCTNWSAVKGNRSRA